MRKYHTDTVCSADGAGLRVCIVTISVSIVYIIIHMIIHTIVDHKRIGIAIVSRCVHTKVATITRSAATPFTTSSPTALDEQVLQPWVLARGVRRGSLVRVALQRPADPVLRIGGDGVPVRGVELVVGGLIGPEQLLVV